MNERTKNRLLYALKARGPQTSADLAAHLDVTTVAVRQHLDGLLDEGLVLFEDVRGTVGRPKRVWSLSEHGNNRFPDNHSGLLLDMLDGVRALYGEDGMNQLINRRETAIRAHYDSLMSGVHQLEERLKLLADQRSKEGYMAEVEQQPDGSFLLIENHCSICAAARACQGFCRSELQLFRDALGPECSVVREEHIVSGARRCTYRVRALKRASASGEA